MKLPVGKPLNLGEAQNFIKSGKERASFNGLVQMNGKTDEKQYTIELLMSSGEVVGIELILGGGKKSGDEGLDQVKTLMGSEGELKLVKFSGKEIEKALEENKNAILGKSIKLEEFKLRIKPVIPKQDAEKKSGFVGLKSIFTGRRPQLKREFKGQFKLEKIPVKEEVTREKSGEMRVEKEDEAKRESWDVKKALISRIKNRRFGRLTEKLLKKRKVKKPVHEPKFTEGKVIETTIDKLFNLVDKRDKLKINDSLAKELGVSREKIEEWAVILEEHNLVTINYPTIGEPELIKKRRK